MLFWRLKEKTEIRYIVIWKSLYTQTYILVAVIGTASCVLLSKEHDIITFTIITN